MNQSLKITCLALFRTLRLFFIIFICLLWFFGPIIIGIIFNDPYGLWFLFLSVGLPFIMFIVGCFYVKIDEELRRAKKG